MSSNDRYLSRDCFLFVSPWILSVVTTVIVSAFIYYAYNAPFWQVTVGILALASFFLVVTIVLIVLNEKSAGSRHYHSVKGNGKGKFQALEAQYMNTDDDSDIHLTELKPSSLSDDKSEEVTSSEEREEKSNEEGSDGPDIILEEEKETIENEEDGEDEGVGHEEFVFENREYSPPETETRIILVMNLLLLSAVIVCLFLYTMRFVIFPSSGLVIASLGSQVNGEQKILLRCFQSEMTFEYGIESDKGNRTRMQVQTNSSSDYTTSITIKHLIPGEKYTAIAECNGESINLRWKTLPVVQEPAMFSFAFGSCMLPRPFHERQGLHTVSQLNPDFFLFMGDFIYADHPVWLSPSKEIYSSYYRDVFSDSYLKPISHEIPSFYMYDDHEIYNDWDGQHKDEFPSVALDVWGSYLESTNPERLEPTGHYFSFDVADSSFFVMDTRMYRTTQKRSETASILGEVQLRHLMEWLRNSTEFTFKVCETLL
eukprot:TRINITY_DN1495_c0_g1_i1.p1 TRINITY_DN1495_c0_g1~~TRINITY_DN1495_c0_g1_i1.p1  ORF type:complete len:484 (+),score=84.00 TRINITY_DN1495_c0_g1_i1:54-1505(+)